MNELCGRIIDHVTGISAWYVVECGLRVAAGPSGRMLEIDAQIVYSSRTYELEFTSINSKGVV